MKPTLIQIISLFGILFITLLTRFTNLTSLPPSLFSDEVDAGYQAAFFNRYQTDYFGNFFPVHFHSFSDWRTSLQIYSISLSQKIFGVNDFSIRFPSALFGSLCILVFYLLTRSLLGSFLFSINPWAIHYSRSSFEVMGMLLMLLLGLYFLNNFSKSLKNTFLYFSLIFFTLSIYFYSTAKLFLVLLFPLILFSYFPALRKLSPKTFLISIFISILLISPFIIDLIKGHAGYRFSYISIFTEPKREQIVDQLRYEDILLEHPDEIGVKTSLTSRLFHNKYQLIINRFFKNYTSSFDLSFLFLTGDRNIRHGFDGIGLLYIIELLSIPVGLYQFFRSKIKNPLAVILFYWLLLSPLPFALTRDVDSPHATRLILMLLPLIYFSALGFISIFKNKHLFIPVLLLFLSFINFWHFYTFHYPQNSARLWHAGIKQAVLNSSKFSGSIVYSDSYEPFLPFFLYYSEYYPVDKNVSWHLTRIDNESFSGQVMDSKYFFGHINWSNLNNFPPSTIFVVPKSETTEINNYSYTILSSVTKSFINQEEFIIFTLNEK